jgi:hypothetical protein
MAFEPYVSFGTRKGIVYELDQYGLPLGTYELDAYDVLQPTTDPYTGIEIYGIRSFDLTSPQPRIIPHFDGDKVGVTQVFPSLDAASGTIVVDGSDLNLESVLANVKKRTVSGMELMSSLSDQQGNEPNVGLLVYQAAKKNNGVQGWHFRFIQSTSMVPVIGPFGDSNYETRYALAPSAVTLLPWGEPFNLDDDGTESAGVVKGFAPTYPPRITTWIADGVEDTFAFDTAQQPPDTTYTVYQAVAGVVTEVTSGITKSTTQIVFAAAPADGRKILVPHMITI